MFLTGSVLLEGNGNRTKRRKIPKIYEQVYLKNFLAIFAFKHDSNL